MLSHSTRVRNRIRGAYLHTEFEINGLRHDPSHSRRPAEGRDRGAESRSGDLGGIRPAGSSGTRHRAA